MTTLVRMLTNATWSPDGHSIVHYGRGELVRSDEPRAHNGFVSVALQAGWAERVHADEASPTIPRSSSITARSAPSKKARSFVERTK